MAAKKPKTALAKLLDTIGGQDALHGGEVVGNDSIPKQDSSIEYKLTESNELRVEEPHDHSTNPTLRLSYIDPVHCRLWKFADRPDDEMGDLSELALSLKTVGQQEPILVRPVDSVDNVKYEIIFGNRRWRACLSAKIEVLAIVKSVSDQEAAIYQKEENEKRKDLSDLARARSYKQQLDGGVFSSEAELSKKLNISRQTLNDIMAFNRVPEILVEEVPNFKNLSRALVVKLAVLAKDKSILPKLIELAPKINGKTITTANIEQHIYKSTQIKGTKAQKKTIKDDSGIQLFTLSQDHHGQVTLKIHHNLSEKYNKQGLEKAVYEYLMQELEKGKNHGEH